MQPFSPRLTLLINDQIILSSVYYGGSVHVPSAMPVPWLDEFLSP